MNASKRTQAERSEATRSALIAAARPLFAEHGYAGLSAGEIVAGAGLTRGALYHHFGGKKELFAAVVEQVEAELTQRIAEVALAQEDPFDQLRTGLAMFLEACTEPEVQRISMIDAPAVLGWEAWREMGMRYGLGIIKVGLQLAMDRGDIDPLPLDPLAHVLLAAVDEGAMLVARSAEPEQAREEMAATFERLLEGLRPPGVRGRAGVRRRA